MKTFNVILVDSATIVVFALLRHVVGVGWARDCCTTNFIIRGDKRAGKLTLPKERIAGSRRVCLMAGRNTGSLSLPKNVNDGLHSKSRSFTARSSESNNGVHFNLDPLGQLANFNAGSGRKWS